jgi:hypothetical protein
LLLQTLAQLQRRAGLLLAQVGAAHNCRPKTTSKRQVKVVIIDPAALISTARALGPVLLLLLL